MLRESAGRAHGPAPAPRGGRREGPRSGAGWGRAAGAHASREPGKVGSLRWSWLYSGCTVGSQAAGMACGVPGRPAQQTSRAGRMQLREEQGAAEETRHSAVP